MPYCHRCSRSFAHHAALSQHERCSSSHNKCWDCSMDFHTPLGLKEHYVQSPQHHYCQRCHVHFDDEHDLLQHYHASHYYCGKCQKFFKNDLGLHEHRRQSEAHHYCAVCWRLFNSASNLREHLNSSTHRSKDVVCGGCNSKFVSAPALVRHFESGTCRSGVDRQAVNRVVRRYDSSNIITNPARMIKSGSNSHECTYSATGASWNGHAYECYICHKEFCSLPALNQHLSSPAHEDRMYVCPLPACRAQFTTLSGLWSHIESEKCGVARFRNVQNVLDGIVGRMGRLTM